MKALREKRLKNDFTAKTKGILVRWNLVLGHERSSAMIYMGTTVSFGLTEKPRAEYWGCAAVYCFVYEFDFG